MKSGLKGLLVTAAVLGGVYLARSILVPFLLAGVIAYTLNPLVAALERRGLRRAYGTIVVMVGLALVVAAAFAIAVPELMTQARNFGDRLPGYRAAIGERLLPFELYLQERYPEQLEELRARALEGVRGVLPTLAGWVVAGFRGVMTSSVKLVVWVLNIVIIPVFTYYLLVDYASIWSTLRTLIPPRAREAIEGHAGECDLVMRTWLRSQLTVALVLALIYAVGLTFLGVPLGLLIGVVGGLANLVPYLGLVVGFLPAAVLAFLETGSWVSPALVAGVFVLGQTLEGTLISPRIVGAGLGLPPALILLAVLIGGQLFGFTGLLLAVPTTAAGFVLVRRLGQVSPRPGARGDRPCSRRPLRRRRPSP